MSDISKFILKIMALLAIFSWAGVGGVLAILIISKSIAAQLAALCWIVGCALLYLYCVDRLTVSGGGHD